MDDELVSHNHIFYEETPRAKYILVTGRTVTIRLFDGDRFLTMEREEVKKLVTILQGWLDYGR